HFKPFGCHVTILNTSDHSGKFDGKADKGYIVGYSASNKAYRVYNVPNKKVEESMNIRFLEEKPNVQGLGHECHFKPFGCHVTILNTSNLLGMFDGKADEGYIELARLKGQEQRATFDDERLGLGFANDAEELQKRASAKTVPPGSIPVPTGSIPVPSGSTSVPSGDTMVSTDDVPVHTSSLTASFFDDEHTTRFPCPSDLRNHDPSPSIFSSLSYDDEFGAAINNVASTVDVIVKERTTATAITKGTWGFEHTKACFRDDVIPFVKNLKELFTSFDQCLIDEVTEVQKIFKQIEMAVEQHCAEKTNFQTKMENVLKENDRLLTYALGVKIVNIVVNDCMNVDEDPRQESECKDQETTYNMNITNNVNTAGINEVNAVGENTNNELPFDLEMPKLEDLSTFNFSSDHEDGDEEANMNNMDTTIQVSPIATTRIHKDHLLDQVIGDLHSTTQTRHMSKNLEEHGAIGTKLVFKNKKDERGIVIRNKVGLVAQGHTQEEGIDYDEVFSLVARIEAIRLFLTYASFKDFVVYQMDVKSAFLYRNIEEDVYVCQPPRFEDPDFPNKVYKVEKALYGLHQAPRAWYETLSTYLLDNGFHIGKIDKTLFIRRYKDDILLVQVYVDDIIFGLQVKQKQDGIFISQDKYVAEILKKYGFLEVKNASTPMETQKPLLKDEDVCAYARYQVNPKVSHLHAMKMIFRYLKGQPKFSLWYPKDSLFDLIAYTDSDYARASLDKKFTTGVNGEVQLQSLVDRKKVIITESTIRRDLQLEDAEGVDCLPNASIFEQLTLMGKTPLFPTMMVQAQEKIGEGSVNPTDAHHTPTIIQPSTSQPQGKQKTRKTKRKDTELPQTSGPTTDVADKAINKEMDDSLVRAATTATSLDAEQDRGVNTP
nr:hypothetical protein [Tanacetum cinerariifolium]